MTRYVRYWKVDASFSRTPGFPTSFWTVTLWKMRLQFQWRHVV